MRQRKRNQVCCSFKFSKFFDFIFLFDNIVHLVKTQFVSNPGLTYKSFKQLLRASRLGGGGGTRDDGEKK